MRLIECTSRWRRPSSAPRAPIDPDAFGPKRIKRRGSRRTRASPSVRSVDRKWPIFNVARRRATGRRTINYGALCPRHINCALRLSSRRSYVNKERRVCAIVDICCVSRLYFYASLNAAARTPGEIDGKSRKKKRLNICDTRSIIIIY